MDADELRKVWQSTDDACLRASVAMVLGLDYRSIPAIRAVRNPSFWAEWMNYFMSNNIEFRASPDLRSKGPWIATVPALGDHPVTDKHAIVMVGDKLFHDPSTANTRKRAPQKIYFGIELTPGRERA